MDMPITTCNGLVILVTSVVSYLGFRNSEVRQRYLFEPESILAGKQYYRLVTSGFLHADWSHLFLNMLTLYWFGSGVEAFVGSTRYLMVYFGAIVGGSLLSLYVHRHHVYQAYGASGGACGLIFAHILLFPWSRIMVFPLPYYIPTWLYAIGFVVGSFYALKRGKDNIGHDAHLGGALVGFLIAAALVPAAVRYNFRIFLLLLGLNLGVLIYLWFNPLFLPSESFLDRGCSAEPKRWRVIRRRPAPRQLKVDDILEKVSKSGIHSLSAEEKAALTRTSEKYRRRADSKKPESDLNI